MKKIKKVFVTITLIFSIFVFSSCASATISQLDIKPEVNTNGIYTATTEQYLKSFLGESDAPNIQFSQTNYKCFAKVFANGLEFETTIIFNPNQNLQSKMAVKYAVKNNLENYSTTAYVYVKDNVVGLNYSTKIGNTLSNFTYKTTVENENDVITEIFSQTNIFRLSQLLSNIYNLFEKGNGLLNFQLFAISDAKKFKIDFLNNNASFEDGQIVYSDLSICMITTKNIFSGLSLVANATTTYNFETFNSSTQIFISQFLDPIIIPDMTEYSTTNPF